MSTDVTITPEVNELLDQLLKDYQRPEDILGDHGLLRQFTQAIIQRALQAELTHHLGYEKYAKHAPAPDGKASDNARNGSTSKTIRSETGEMSIQVPRDRNSTFTPVLVPKRQRRIGKFDDLILSLYTRGMTQAEIAEHIQDIYGVELSVELISSITDAVLEEVKAWQGRPLAAVYPIVYLDAIVVKARAGGHVAHRVIYLAIGVDMTGHKDILGFWACESEGAKFWLTVLTELKNRGVKDILIACVDGLKGFPEAIQAVFPLTDVQLCIVHLIRCSTKQVAWKEMKAVTRDLRAVYTAPNAEQAERELEAFDQKWGGRYPMIAKAWRAVWPNVIPFFKFPDDIRRAIYTTNAIESVNASIRYITNNRALFPNDEAVFKLLYLALTNASRKWTMPISHWKQALQQFAIVFAGRVPLT